MTGVDAPPPLPSLVQTRLTRIDKALERLTEDVNDVDAVHAPKAGKVVRRQLAAAWRGARYYITHAPPPPAEEARAGELRQGVRVRDLAPRVRAKVMQDDEGPVIADPVDDRDGRVRPVPQRHDHDDRAHRRRSRPRCSTP